MQLRQSLISAYEGITQLSHGYLLIDFRQDSLTLCATECVGFTNDYL